MNTLALLAERLRPGYKTSWDELEEFGHGGLLGMEDDDGGIDLVPVVERILGDAFGVDKVYL